VLTLKADLGLSDGVAWMKAGMEAVSGKGGGGKGGLAQGQGQGVAQLDTCQAAAEAFAKMELA
jgi:alanyl-tRNA synthetase